MEKEKFVSDMYLAAAYLAYGATLLGIDRSDHKRLKFIFSRAGMGKIYYKQFDGELQVINDPTLDDIEDLFIAKSLVFPPSYPDAIKSIKTAIHL